MRFGEAIHHFSQIIRRGILDSVDKEYYPKEKKGYVKRYLKFNEIPVGDLPGTWFILGRVNTTVNELRLSAKLAGLYYADNKGNKSFDQKQWEAIKAWTRISKDKSISKLQAENMYKYIRELKDLEYRTMRFWLGCVETKMYDFQELVEWCGLDMQPEDKERPWWEILTRNFTPAQTEYFVRLLKRYGQETLNGEPKIIIDTIHSVKGGEANNVILYSKANWPSNFLSKNINERSDERRVIYTGVTRAKDTLHILSSDHRYNYPIGQDYLVYLKEKEL